MNKTNKPFIDDLIDNSDLIIEVVDSRFVDEARVKGIENKIASKNKKFIIAVNKIDLVPTRFILDIKGYLNRERFKDEAKSMFGLCVLSAKYRFNTKALWSLLNRFVLKSGKSSIVIGVIGLPNSGKSSLINILKGRHSAKTSSIPGFTKSIQFVRISKKILLIDSPGIVNVNDDDLTNILLCSYPLDKVNYDLVYGFLSMIIKSKLNVWRSMEQIYKIHKSNNPKFIIEQVAFNMNLKAKKGLPDVERAAKKIVMDWYNGKLNFYWLKRKNKRMQKNKNSENSR